MAVGIILWSISMKAWDGAVIELTTLGSAVRLVTNCTTGIVWIVKRSRGISNFLKKIFFSLNMTYALEILKYQF